MIIPENKMQAVVEVLEQEDLTLPDADENYSYNTGWCFSDKNAKLRQIAIKIIKSLDVLK